MEKVKLPEMERGPWKVEKFTVPKGAILFRHRHLVPGEYTRLVHRDRGLMMSDTPAEMLDHLPFVGEARGRVLIGGLGLGMCIAAVLAKSEVELVHVVEIDPDIIAMVGPHYSDPRLKIIQGDFRDYCPKGQKYDVVWSDIWGDVSEDDIPEMIALHKRWRRRSQWHGCWGENLILEG